MVVTMSPSVIALYIHAASSLFWFSRECDREIMYVITNHFAANCRLVVGWINIIAMVHLGRALT